VGYGRALPPCVRSRSILDGSPRRLQLRRANSANDGAPKGAGRTGGYRPIRRCYICFHMAGSSPLLLFQRLKRNKEIPSIFFQKIKFDNCSSQDA